MAELYHLGVATSLVPQLAVLVDPMLSTTPLVAATGGRQVATRREYVNHLGLWDGKPVLVTTVGVGAPPLAIAVEELARAGMRTVVLMGTATFVDVNSSWLLPHGAVRGDGTSAQYAPLAFPAVPDPGLRARLADETGGHTSYGLVETVDVLDGASTSPMNIAARDLRCAALFVVAAAKGVRAAAVLADAGTPDTTGGRAGHDMAGAVLRSLTAADIEE